MLFPSLCSMPSEKNGHFLNCANWKTFSNVLHACVSSRAHHWSQHLLDWINQDCTVLHGALDHFSGKWTFEHRISWMKFQTRFLAMADRTLLNWEESRSKKEDGEKVETILSPLVFFLLFVCFIQGAKLTINDIHEAVQGFLQHRNSCFPSFPWYCRLSWAAFNVVQKFPPTTLFSTSSKRWCTRSVSSLGGVVRWKKGGTGRFKYTGKAFA